MSNVRQCIVTTTINPPTESTLAWVNRPKYTLIIVGDKKTPHKEYEDLVKKQKHRFNNFVYISPEEQESLSKDLSDAIGWGCIQRRNMGFVYALKAGFEVIGTFDDDNIIYDSWDGSNAVERSILCARRGDAVEASLYENNRKKAFDPFSVFSASYHHRGYPLEYVKDKNDIFLVKKSIPIKALVDAPIPHGDPDIDAITRITQSPWLDRYQGGNFTSTQIVPFNSQCTFLHRKLIPYYFMLTGVGRHDDILGAYLLQKRWKENDLGGIVDPEIPFIVFSNTIARQDRNPHDLTKDLQNEIFGYCNSGKYIEASSWKHVLPEKTLETYNMYTKLMLDIEEEVEEREYKEAV